MNVKLIVLSSFLMLFGCSETMSQKNNMKWNSKTYNVTGDWQIQSNEGKSVLVFEDNFKTSRGPDVKVYLSKKKIEDIGKRESIDKSSLLLGKIKFRGSQEFLIPDGIDIKNYSSIVIHCQAYSVVWGGTNLRNE